MATTVTNKSYITDLTELWLYVDEYRVREAASVDLPDENPEDTISDAVTDKITQAMNTGRETIDSFLRRTYPISLTRGLVETVNATSPGEPVKMRNARLVEYFLIRKRLALEDEIQLWNRLRIDLKELQRANAEELLGDAERTEQLVAARGPDATPDRLRGRQSVFDSIDGASWGIDSLMGEKGSSDQ